MEILPLSQFGVVKSPATQTAEASGAQQRKVQLPLANTAPIPGADAGVAEEIAGITCTPDVIAGIRWHPNLKRAGLNAEKISPRKNTKDTKKLMSHTEPMRRRFNQHFILFFYPFPVWQATLI